MAVRLHFCVYHHGEDELVVAFDAHCRLDKAMVLVSHQEEFESFLCSMRLLLMHILNLFLLSTAAIVKNIICRTLLQFLAVMTATVARTRLLDLRIDLLIGERLLCLVEIVLELERLRAFEDFTDFRGCSI